MANLGYVNIKGPFLKGAELNNTGKTIRHIGVQCKPEHEIILNGKIFTIGKTGVLDINEVEINSVKFNQNEDEFTIIDMYIL